LLALRTSLFFFPLLFFLVLTCLDASRLSFFSLPLCLFTKNTSTFFSRLRFLVSQFVSSQQARLDDALRFRFPFKTERSIIRLTVFRSRRVSNRVFCRHPKEVSLPAIPSAFLTSAFPPLFSLTRLRFLLPLFRFYACPIGSNQVLEREDFAPSHAFLDRMALLFFAPPETYSLLLFSGSCA